MKQLTGLDAAFLYMETPTTFGHVSGLGIYDTPANSDETPYELYRNRLEERLAVLDPFRRRLVEVPFGLDHPWWIEDPDFDLDFHLRHIAVPPPGGSRELSDLVARIIARPLDRSRPLWEVYVIEGLENGRWAALTKVHHATIDGAAGAEMMMMLLDSEDARTDLPIPPLPEPERLPTPLEMMGRTAMSYASRPRRFFAAQSRMAADFFEIMSKNGGALAGAVTGMARNSLPRPNGESRDDGAGLLAPRTPFNRAITANRRFAYRTYSLDEVKEIKNHFGATVNDVVMAATAGALRRYLERHQALPEKPLVAAVPVSIRTGQEEDMWTNRVSSIVARIPTHLADAAERISFAAGAMNEAKGNFELVPAEALVNLSEFSPPALFTQAAGAMTRFRMGDHIAQPSNLIVSNVPGPRKPMFLGSARLVHYYPVSTIAEGQGLNVTVQSLENRLDLGLVACRELVPDLEDLADDFGAELGHLLEIARESAG